MSARDKDDDDEIEVGPVSKWNTSEGWEEKGGLTGDGAPDRERSKDQKDEQDDRQDGK